MLEIRNLYKHFDGVAALDDLSLTVAPGEVVGIIGPNGAGKTTLFNALCGFLPLDSGEVVFNGVLLNGRSPHRIANLGIARAFQDLRLIMKMTVLDNVLLAMKGQKGESVLQALFNFKGVKNQDAENRKKAGAFLEVVSIEDKAFDLAEDLSYGQQKLLSLACCLASDAPLLLLDEPVAGINPELIEKILGLIKKLKEEGKTVIIIEHNMDAVAKATDRVIVMDTGRKIAEGSHADVIKDAVVQEAYLE